jgi:oligopeptide/dipeptide ABC transporter ATP-binding protein
MSDPILEVEDLVIEIRTRNKTIRPADGVSFHLDRGQSLGIVGESGSGKSLTLRAICGLLPRAAEIGSGRILFEGVNLLTLKPSSLNAIRGQGIGMVFQEPMTALNPVMRVGDQIAEAPRVHRGLSKGEAARRAVELMELVGIPDAGRRARAYPHEFSGGMRQRIMIAVALSSEPKVLLCDEPTTALDVTIQDQILDLLSRLCDHMRVGLVFVTHDLGVVARMCAELAVMYAGQIVETGSVSEIFQQPRHPYTAALLQTVPDFYNVRRGLLPIPGAPPDPSDLPAGCRFHPRCQFADERCVEGEFPLLPRGSGRQTACIHSDRCVRTVGVSGG